jgi:hypothetical protein
MLLLQRQLDLPVLDIVTDWVLDKGPVARVPK